MSILLNMPPGWQPNVKHLSTQMREGTAAIQKAVSRLKQLGYLVCRSIRDAFGRFLRTDWDINEIPNPVDAGTDARGNVVAFDVPQESPKNLRREAKTRAKSTQKPVPEQQPQNRTPTSLNPYPENPDTGFADRSNIDIRSIDLENIEREQAALNKIFREEKSRAVKDKKLRSDKKQESFTQQKISEEDQFSATVASGFLTDECSPLGKGETVEQSQAEPGNSQILEFKRLLEELGKQLGKKSPTAWAYKIVENLLETGKPCTYWEEFCAGVPLGTSDQREWESAPGVPCAIAVQCLHADFLAIPGTTAAEAARRTAEILARPDRMAVIWETIKAQVISRRDEWKRQEALGVQVPNVPHWMIPRDSVSFEEAAIALHEIQSVLPPALQPAQESFSNSEIVGEAMERAIAQDPNSEIVGEAMERAIAQDSISTNEVTESAVAAKANISKILSKFARPTKKRAVLDANIAEARSGEFTTPVEKASNFGGLADFLLQLNVVDEVKIEDDDIW
jgi:hypothetical protein